MQLKKVAKVALASVILSGMVAATVQSAQAARPELICDRAQDGSWYCYEP